MLDDSEPEEELGVEEVAAGVEEVVVAGADDEAGGVEDCEDLAGVELE